MEGAGDASCQGDSSEKVKDGGQSGGWTGVLAGLEWV